MIGDQPLQRMDYDEMVIGPVRMLADCESKRRIVEGCSMLAGPEVGAERPWFAIWAEVHVLRALAQSYVDHPDFDPDWRL